MPTVIHRVPADFKFYTATISSKAPAPILGLGEPEGYARHEGGLHSRILGNAVHKLLEHLSRLRTTLDWDASRAALEQTRPRIVASIRTSGIPKVDADKIAARAFDSAIQASHNTHGQWILSPRLEGGTEAGWAGMISGNLHQIRVDRIFRAGLTPLEAGDDALWIIDYKTAHVDKLDASTLPELRKTFAPQLQMYATVLRNLRGAATPIRAGLYYPLMSIFDWWEA
jgi:ATP-dependent exoDNAse (exonuclease V) beta subunit